MCIIHGEKRSRDEVDEVGGEHAAGAEAEAATSGEKRQRGERGGKKKNKDQRRSARGPAESRR